MPEFTLRTATHNEVALTYDITKDAMRRYVELTWGTWVDEDQLQKHRGNFDPATHRIIVLRGLDAGLLVTETESNFVWLVKLYLLSTYRNKGLGAALLAHVFREADALGKSVRLRVLKVNMAAQRFYIRHGFTVVGEETERLFMVRARVEA
jgi:GNAT superfamily N-acetyltransferase